MTDAPHPGPAPRRTSYRALAESVRIAARADFRYLLNRGEQEDMLRARLEEAAQELDRMEPGTSGDSFERPGDTLAGPRT